MTRPRLPRFHVYLLLGRTNGHVYLGYSANLRRRFKTHNSPDNKGSTRHQSWHLLAVKCFLDRDTALLYEQRLKRSRYDKRNWVRRERSRLRELCRRHGIKHRLA